MSVAAFLDPAGWFRPEAGPRYRQLYQRLRDGMAQGVLPPGAPLPPERDVAALAGVSRVTVRKAIRILADEGLVDQRQGSGSFVASRPTRFEQKLSRLTSFSEDMAKLGKTVSARWLERGVFMPTAPERAALGLSEDDSVARVGRLRFSDGEPVAVERASLPIDILPNPLAVEVSLYAVLDRAGHRPVRAQQTISAINVSAPEAELLAIAPGAAGLRIERTSYLANGRVAEFTQSLYRGDAYNFVAELTL